jgi:hypothetical protein
MTRNNHALSLRRAKGALLRAAGIAVMGAAALLAVSPAWAAGSTAASGGAAGAANALSKSAAPRPLPGDLPLDRFPDSASIRAWLYADVLAGPRDSVLARKPAVYSNEYGNFRVSTEKSADAFYVILAPAKGGDFPVWAQGSWIIKRSLADGRFLQAKVFLRSDPGTFLRIFPNGDRSLMDVVVYGAVLNTDVPLPVNFDQALGSSMASIVQWSRSIVGWDLFSPHPGDYDDLLAFSAAVRSRLPGLRFADDGGLDTAGRPVLIATGAPQGPKPGLNCSGFAQWVIDGLLAPLGLPLLDPGAMAEKHPELRGARLDAAIEARYEPYFGLDWTRNLGRAWADALGPSRSHAIDENDVRISPFAYFSPGGDARNGGPPYDVYPAYDRDSGYPIRGLKAMLYVLAMRDPGAAYLASLSRLNRSGLRRHYHVALLLPYFDRDGQFKVDVFESTAETSLGAVLARTTGDYFHLVRIEPSRDFDPPRLP